MEKDLEDNAYEGQLRSWCAKPRAEQAEGRPHGSYSSSQGVEGQR